MKLRYSIYPSKRPVKRLGISQLPPVDKLKLPNMAISLQEQYTFRIIDYKMLKVLQFGPNQTSPRLFQTLTSDLIQIMKVVTNSRVLKKQARTIGYCKQN